MGSDFLFLEVRKYVFSQWYVDMLRVQSTMIKEKTPMKTARTDVSVNLVVLFINFFVFDI